MALDAHVTHIYALRDPRDGEIRYVGKSNDPKQRLRFQISRAKHAPSTHLHSWIRGLLAEDLKPDQIILDAVAHNDWKSAEAAWMAEMIRDGCRLVNLAAGGEGPTFGHEQSNAEKQTRSIAMKKRYEDPAEREKTAIAIRKALAMASPEQKQRQSEAGKIGYRASLGLLTPEERSRNSSRTARSQHREKLPDGRSKHAVMLGKTTMSKPGHAAEIGKLGALALQNSDAGRKRISVASRMRWQDPKYRSRLSDSQKDAWSKKSSEELSEKAHKAWVTRREKYGPSGVADPKRAAKNIGLAGRGRVPWNKGRTETRPEVLAKISSAGKGRIPWNKGRKETRLDVLERQSKSHIGKKRGKEGK
ncbi:hypothetical protein LCGC14_1814790 [marine sediment metagenome]|uniref:GIY-YIG domain-containing protein n=1 Tax=marine sediment metagenome TaxID=412755 RepID=A0A0F9JKB1_9ZZZZ